MPEEENNKVKNTVEAVTALAKAIPVYGDAVQPAAKEIGKSLATVAKAVNIALAPISAMVWGFEKIKDFVETRVSELLKNVSKEKIISPDAAIVGPSLEALRFVGKDEHLRELFASLIATSMHADEASDAHPGFVEIIKNLSSDEAKIIQHFYAKEEVQVVDVLLYQGDGRAKFFGNISNLESLLQLKNSDLCANYIDNLLRLGMIEFYDLFTKENATSDLENHPKIMKFKKQFLGARVGYREKLLVPTGYGYQFMRCCLPKPHKTFPAVKIISNSLLPSGRVELDDGLLNKAD